MLKVICQDKVPLILVQAKASLKLNIYKLYGQMSGHNSRVKA